MNSPVQWNRSAVLSDCARYRYKLERTAPSHLWAVERVVLFVGLNPSTADGLSDDATVRKWKGFSEHWGFTAFEAVNLFAFRSTDPRQLLSVRDPVGPLNDVYIRHAIERCDQTVLCWGDGKGAELRRLIARRLDHLQSSFAEAHCLGLTRTGNPKHVLMLPYSSALTAWRNAA